MNKSGFNYQPLDSITNITTLIPILTENRVLVQVSDGVYISPNMTRILEYNLETHATNKLFQTYVVSKNCEKGGSKYYLANNANLSNKNCIVTQKWNSVFAIQKTIVIYTPVFSNVMTAAIKFVSNNLYFGTYGTQTFDYTHLYKFDSDLNKTVDIKLDPDSNALYLNAEIGIIRPTSDGNLLLVLRYVGKNNASIEKKDLNLKLIWQQQIISSNFLYLISFVETARN